MQNIEFILFTKALVYGEVVYCLINVSFQHKFSFPLSVLITGYKCQCCHSNMTTLLNVSTLNVHSPFAVCSIAHSYQQSH